MSVPPYDKRSGRGAKDEEEEEVGGIKTGKREEDR
jgi:hypothetical protein